MTPENIMGIFPIGIYANELTPDFYSIINELNTEEMKDKNPEIFSFAGIYSKNTYILNNPKYQKLSEFILKESTEYGYNVLGIDSKEYKITQSWLSHKPPNCEHHAHVHPNSIISGVIFYGEYNQELPSLQFFKSYNYLDFHSSSMLRTCPNNIDNSFTHNTISIKYKPNTLILFPSYLQHGVGKNNTNITRKSLAFNIVPKVLGHEMGLNELKL